MKEARNQLENALLCYHSERHDVREALLRHGWTATQAAPVTTAPVPDLPVSGVTVLVVGQGSEADQVLLEAERCVQQSERPLVLLLDGASAAHERWATRLTPFCYPKSLAAESVACLLDRIAESLARAESGPAETVERRVTLRLGESVEVDGACVRLGVAERNLLWELACSRDRRVAKDSAIDAGPGRRVVARECRRRLGRSLGDELASLLVPSERNEPYRLREPEELRRRCLELPERHPFTELRIIGRSDVRLSFREDLDLLGPH